MTLGCCADLAFTLIKKNLWHLYRNLEASYPSSGPGAAPVAVVQDRIDWLSFPHHLGRGEGGGGEEEEEEGGRGEGGNQSLSRLISVTLTG